MALSCRSPQIRGLLGTGKSLSFVRRSSRKSMQMRHVVKVSAVRSMPSGPRRRGPSVLRRPAHGGLHAQRSSKQEQSGRGLRASRACIRIHCQGGAASIGVPLRRAVSRPNRAWRSEPVSQGVGAQPAVRAVRPSAASARSVRRVASHMQQPNTLVPFGQGAVSATTATPNQSVKRTCKSGLRPLPVAAYLQLQGLPRLSSGTEPR